MSFFNVHNPTPVWLSALATKISPLLYKGESQQEYEESFLAQFGELLDAETEAQVKYIRAQKKSRFTRGLRPDALWDLWDKRYPKTLLCNDWLYQSVFRGDTSEAAQQEYLDYLYKCCSNPPPDWVRFHMTVEFSNPLERYESQSSGVYSLPPVTLERRNWWDVLRVDPLIDYAQIKSAYQKLSVQCQHDEDMLKLLNWALQTGKQALGVYEWDDLIRWTDAEIKRLGWSKKQAKDYLVSNYGKRSRQLLSDKEMLGFWKQLKQMEPDT